MIFLWIFLGLIGLLLLLAISIFVSKVVIKLHTVDQEYSIHQSFIFKVRMLSDEERPLLIKCRILFIPFSIDLEKLAEKRKSKSNKQEKPKSKSNRSRKRKKESLVSWKMIRSVLKKIRFKYFHVSFDPNDPVIAGNLIPIFQVLNAMTPEKYSVQVNYLDEFQISTRIEIRPSSIVKAIIINRK